MSPEAGEAVVCPEKSAHEAILDPGRYQADRDNLRERPDDRATWHLRRLQLPVSRCSEHADDELDDPDERRHVSPSQRRHGHWIVEI